MISERMDDDLPQDGREEKGHVIEGAVGIRKVCGRY
jgi:hypothetical protein